jgi:hypothetical protein
MARRSHWRLAYFAHEFHRGAQLAYPSNARRDDWMSRYQAPGLQEMSVHHFDMWYYRRGSRIVNHARPFDPIWKHVQSPASATRSTRRSRTARTSTT